MNLERALVLTLALAAGPVPEAAGPAAEPATDAASDRFFPTGNVFRPLVADPKEPRFFVSYLAANAEAGHFSAASVGLGTTFGIVRGPLPAPRDSWQLDVLGAVFSQFNLDTPSHDLINTDFLVGLALSGERGPWSSRLRYYHQSSHLGDELLLDGDPPERINLSYETLDLVLARDIDNVRIYAGAGYLLRHEPEDLDRASLQAGLEFHAAGGRLPRRLSAGLDVKWLEELNRDPGVHLQLGFRLGRLERTSRGVTLTLEGYDGFVPFGQFFTDDITYYGIGFALTF